MSEPPRLLGDPTVTPFERDLLASWDTEQPSAEARARALAMAGAAAGTLAATAGAVAGTAPKAAAAGAAAFTKWVVIGAVILASAAGVGAVVAVTRSPQSDTAATAKAPATTPTVPVASVATAEPPTVSPADLPTAPSAAIPSAPATVHARPSTGDATLSEEIASFDRARAALAAGRADQSLVLIDAYEKRFPTGTFIQEAEVLRVEALSRRGDHDAAVRVGQRFLAAHPTSPHAERIRAILQTSNP
jgi:TolA-binding protein